MLNKQQERLKVLRIKQVMEEKHISSGLLAIRIGCAPSYICNVASGRQNISLDKLAQFADALGVEIKELFN